MNTKEFLTNWLIKYGMEWVSRYETQRFYTKNPCDGYPVGVGFIEPDNDYSQYRLTQKGLDLIEEK